VWITVFDPGMSVSRFVRSRFLLTAVFALAVALPGSVAAHPEDGERIRHGAGIGKLRLGMTYAEVRRILGGPQTVDKRERLSGGRRYLEFSWDYGWWTVGFMGRPNRMRVVSIQTLNRRERTVEGLGVGSLERAVRRALRVRCLWVAERVEPEWSIEARCAYASHPGRETVFLLDFGNGRPYRRLFKQYQVVAVRVHERRGDFCLRGGYVCEQLP
jgi:hypothetical protein